MADLKAGIARLRAATGAASAVSVREVQEAISEQVVETAVHEKVVAAVESNTFHKIWQDPSKSMRQKLDEMAAYLTVENADYAEGQRRYGEFKLYFAHSQNEATKLDLKGMEGLEKELKEMTRATIAKIVQDLTKVQNGMAETEKLLDIANKARLDGKTLEQMREAITRNDQIIAEIESLRVRLGTAEKEVVTKETTYKTQLDRKTDSEKGFGNKIMRFARGPDTEIAQAIELAAERLRQQQEYVQTVKDTLAEKERERRVELEDGSLAILRTMEATEDDINATIIRTAESSRALIEGAMDQVTNLIRRAQFSDKVGIEIGQQIDANEQRVKVLKGAIRKASTSTNEQGASIKKNLDAIDEEMAAMEKDGLEWSLKAADRVDIDQKYKGSLGHEKDLNEAFDNLNVLDGESADARSRAIQFSSFVKGMEKALTQLNTVSLPSTAKQLHLMLQTQHALQTDELGASINAFNQAGQEITAKQLERMVTAQQDLHRREMTALDTLTTMITDATTTNATYAQTIIDQGSERQDRQQALTDSTARLNETLAALQEIATAMTGRPTEEPAHPESAIKKSAAQGIGLGNNA